MGFAIFPEPIQVLVLTSTHYPAGTCTLADSGFSVKYRHSILLIWGAKSKSGVHCIIQCCLRRFYLWNSLIFHGLLLSCSLESNLHSRLFCNRLHRKSPYASAKPQSGVMCSACRPFYIAAAIEVARTPSNLAYSGPEKGQKDARNAEGGTYSA